MRNGVQTREIREAILDATDRLLSTVGYKKMTIDDLAREVGIGKGSIYLHFTSKEEIALSHVDRIVERLGARLLKIAAEDISCESRIRRMLMERVLFRFDSVQHYTRSFDDLLSAIRPSLMNRRARYFEDESEIFARVINEGIEKGELASGDVPGHSECLLLATNSLLPLSLTTKELGERAEIEEKVLCLANLLLTGLIRRENVE
jgi:AcrR family transcriptional regulator